SSRWCIFFFSSRRRHTRFSRDWSSDVCSSDLLPDLPAVDLRIVPTEALLSHERHDAQRTAPLVKYLRRDGVLKNPPIVTPSGLRSEERRVGKECRNRREAYLEANKPEEMRSKE